MNRLFSTIATIPILFLARLLTQGLPYTPQGFFCDDNEIRYPNREDTVPSHTMHFIYGLFAICVLTFCELSLIKSLRDFRLNWHQCLLNFVLFFGIYTSSVLSVSVSLNVFKRTSSRLRPNFIDVCKPKDLYVVCPFGSNNYVENFTCTGESRPDLHFSFPSGHAAHSIFFATFIISIIHMRSRLPLLLKIYAQFAVFVFAVFVCLSRVRDYKHRYVDVAGGGLLGFAIGLGLIELVLRGLNAPLYVLSTENFQNKPILEKATNYKSIP